MNYKKNPNTSALPVTLPKEQGANQSADIKSLPVHFRDSETKATVLFSSGSVAAPEAILGALGTIQGFGDKSASGSMEQSQLFVPAGHSSSSPVPRPPFSNNATNVWGMIRHQITQKKLKKEFCKIHKPIPKKKRALIEVIRHINRFIRQEDYVPAFGIRYFKQLVREGILIKINESRNSLFTIDTARLAQQYPIKENQE